MPRTHRLKVTPSSGNVFRDMGFPTEDAAHLLIRADLLIQLQKAIAARNLTQAKAATTLRVTQPRAVALVDRLTHHAEIIPIEGESYRKREAELTQKKRRATP